MVSLASILSTWSPPYLGSSEYASYIILSKNAWSFIDRLTVHNMVSTKVLVPMVHSLTDSVDEDRGICGNYPLSTPIVADKWPF